MPRRPPSLWISFLIFAVLIQVHLLARFLFERVLPMLCGGG